MEDREILSLRVRNKIVIGDCREVMKQMIADGVKVQTCVTSPPYWGLRDYGIAPSVWGGEASCSHKWGRPLKLHKGGPHGDGVLLVGSRSVVEAQASVKDIRTGQFCQHCGAWLGCLGLEPTYQLYIEHMVEVFRLIRDVLADDGTVWLNLGDSYTSGGRKERDPGQSKMHPACNGEAFADGLRPGTPDGLKPKDLVGIPWRVAFALQADGWYLRQDIIWSKPNPTPESVTDRCTKSHEYIFLLSKRERYYYDAEAISEPAGSNDHRRPHAPGQIDSRGNGYDRGGGQLRKTAGKHSKMPKQSSGHRIVENVARARAEGADHDNPFGTTRNKRSVWTVATKGYSEAHFATFPPALIGPCILAGSRAGDIVLDPFFGSGTVGEAAQHLGRHWIGIDLNPEYERLARQRTQQTGLAL